MKKRNLVFYCQQIFDDFNRAQFNRVNYLCNKYSVYILADGPVSHNASRNASAVFLFPGRRKRSRLFSPIWALFKLKRLRKEIGCFLLYSTYEPRTIISSFLAKKILKLEWILDLWDNPDKSLLILKELKRRKAWSPKLAFRKLEMVIVRRVLRHADRVIAAVRTDIEKEFGVSGNRILYVTNGVNTGIGNWRSKNRSNVFTLFYCGTVEQIRLEGIREMLEIVSETIRPLRLEVIGNEINSGYQWFQSELQDLSEQVIIEKPGVGSFSTVLDSIQASDICICPYPAKMDLPRTYPIKIPEYMILRKPVVASSLPGIRTYITHGKDGMLFEPGDYKTMADQIILLFRSPELRRRISGNAHRTALKFSWEIIHDRISRFLDEENQSGVLSRKWNDSGASSE